MNSLFDTATVMNQLYMSNFSLTDSSGTYYDTGSMNSPSWESDPALSRQTSLYWDSKLWYENIDQQEGVDTLVYQDSSNNLTDASSFSGHPSLSYAYSNTLMDSGSPSVHTDTISSSYDNSTTLMGAGPFSGRTDTTPLSYNSSNISMDVSSFSGRTDTPSLTFSPQSTEEGTFDDKLEEFPQSPAAGVDESSDHTLIMYTPDSETLISLCSSNHFINAFPHTQLGPSGTLPENFSVHQQISDCVKHNEGAIKLVCVDTSCSRRRQRSMYLCIQCQGIAQNSGDMSRHLARHQKPSVKCLVSTCPRMFTREDSMLRHHQWIHGLEKKEKVKRQRKTAEGASSKAKKVKKGRKGRNRD